MDITKYWQDKTLFTLFKKNVINSRFINNGGIKAAFAKIGFEKIQKADFEVLYCRHFVFPLHFSDDFAVRGVFNSTAEKSSGVGIRPRYGENLENRPKVFYYWDHKITAQRAHLRGKCRFARSFAWDGDRPLR